LYVYVINEFIKKWSQFASFKLVANVGSYTQGRIVPSNRDQTEKLLGQKDTHRKPPLPSLGS